MDFIQEFINNIIARLQLPNVMFGIIFAAVGIAIAVLAKRIARVFRKTDHIADDDRVMVSVKIVGLVLLIIALMILVFG